MVAMPQYCTVSQTGKIARVKTSPLSKPLTPSNRVLVEKLIFAQLLKKSPPPVAAECSSPCSQDIASGPFLEPYKSSSHPYTTHFNVRAYLPLGFLKHLFLLGHLIKDFCAMLMSPIKGKTITVAGHGDPYGCETSRLPYFLENRLTDGGEFVSLTRWPPFTPKNIAGTHFCLRLSRPQGLSAAGRIRSIEKSNDHIGNRTRDLPACSIVPQPTTLHSSCFIIGVPARIRNGPMEVRNVTA
jgi:hypothetical protein